MQPPVVIANGSRFLLCVGNHRCEALRRNGESEVECLVLPENTPPKEALIRSLHENHVRHDEVLVDILKRVTALKEFHGCKSFAEAATLAGLKESKVSKIRFAVDNLSPQAKAVVHEQKIGWSVAYEVAKRADGADEQVAWLASHARGEMNRSAIIEQTKQKAVTAKSAKKAAKKPVTSATPQPVRLQGKIDGVNVKLVVPATAGADAVGKVLTALSHRLAEHCRLERPLSSFSFT
jgi:ParB-like chromosome segregation protein Spo0J